MNETGIVQEVIKEIINTKKGKTPRWVLKINNIRYSTFRDCSNIKITDLVEFSYDVNGEYKNISEVTVMAKPKIESAHDLYRQKQYEIRGLALMKIATRIILGQPMLLNSKEFDYPDRIDNLVKRLDAGLEEYVAFKLEKVEKTSG